MIICKNCAASFEGNFCNHCGQKNYTEKDKSIKHLIEDVFHFVTHFEGAFFTTLKTIFVKPGTLTVDYCNGIRKKYFKPISFFLLMVILYLLFPLFKGLNPQMSHYKNNIFTVIEQQIEEKIQTDHISEEDLSRAFEMKSHTVSKFSLLLLIPFSAIIISLLFYRKRVLFDNFIVATEINIFYMLMIFLLMPLAFMIMAFIGLNPSFFDDDLTITYGAGTAFVIYCSIVFHKVFQAKWWIAIITALLFSFIHFTVIFFLYRFIVFEITFMLL
ncbi:MAG: DUF3667 domain-containing protein [Bacteroidota bacterium]